MPLHLHFVAFVFRCVFVPRVAFCGVWVQSHFHTSRQYSFPQAPPFTYSKTEICGLYSMISFSVVELKFRVHSLYVLCAFIVRSLRVHPPFFVHSSSVFRAFILPFSCIHCPFSARPSSIHRLYTVRSSVRFALAFEFNENGTGTFYDRYCT